MTFTIYQSKRNKKWYWRLKSSNQRIIADGSEGYTRMQSALRGVYRFIRTIKDCDKVKIKIC